MSKIVKMIKSETCEFSDEEDDDVVKVQVQEDEMSQSPPKKEYLQEKYEEIESLLMKRKDTTAIDKIDMSKFRRAYKFISIQEDVKQGIVEGR